LPLSHCALCCADNAAGFQINSPTCTSPLDHPRFLFGPWAVRATHAGRIVEALVSARLRHEENGVASSSDRPFCGGRRRHGDGAHRRLLCHVHLCRCGASSIAGRLLERRLVSALVVRGDQLHEQLGVRLFRRRRLLDRRFHLHQLDASAATSALSNIFPIGRGLALQDLDVIRGRKTRTTEARGKRRGIPRGSPRSSLLVHPRSYLQ
jgi:hypothetical protein